MHPTSTLPTLTGHAYLVYVAFATAITVPVAVIWHGLRVLFDHWRHLAERRAHRPPTRHPS